MVFKRHVTQGRLHHIGVQVAAFSGIDLVGARSRGSNPISIMTRLLVALNNGHFERFFGFHNRSRQEFGLSRTGTRNQIQSQNLLLPKQSAICLGNHIVAPQNVFFNGDGARFGNRHIMRVMMVMTATTMRTHNFSPFLSIHQSAMSSTTRISRPPVGVK